MSDFADLINASLRPRPEDEDDESSFTNVINASLNPMDRGYHARVFSGLAETSGGNVEALPPPYRRQLGQSARALSLQGGFLGQNPDHLRQLAQQADDLNQRDEGRQATLDSLFQRHAAQFPLYGESETSQQFQQEATDRFRKEAAQQAPWLAGDQVDNLAGGLKQAAMAVKLRQAVERERANRPKAGEVLTRKFTPFVPDAIEAAEGWASGREAEDFRAGRVGNLDFLARQIVDQEERAGQSQASRALETAAGMPKFLAEWALLGGVAGLGRSAAEAGAGGLATRFLGAGAGRVAAGLAGPVGAGAARTAADLPGLAAATYRGAAPDVRRDEEGNYHVGAGKPLGEAAWDAIRSKAIENVTFEALHPFAAQEGDRFLARWAKGLSRGVVTAEAAKELQYWGANAPQGSALHQIAAAREPEDARRALAEFMGQVAAFGGVESFMQARGQARARVTELKSLGLSDQAAQQQAASELQALRERFEQIKAQNADWLQQVLPGERQRIVEGIDSELGPVARTAGRGLLPPEAPAPTSRGERRPGPWEPETPLPRDRALVPYQSNLPAPVRETPNIWTPGPSIEPEPAKQLPYDPRLNPRGWSPRALPPEPDVDLHQPPGGWTDPALLRVMARRRGENVPEPPENKGQPQGDTTGVGGTPPAGEENLTPRQQADALEQQHNALQARLLDVQATERRLLKEKGMGLNVEGQQEAARQERLNLQRQLGGQGWVPGKAPKPDSLIDKLDRARSIAASQEQPAPPPEPVAKPLTGLNPATAPPSNGAGKPTTAPATKEQAALHRQILGALGEDTIHEWDIHDAVNEARKEAGLGKVSDADFAAALQRLHAEGRLDGGDVTDEHHAALKQEADNLEAALRRAEARPTQEGRQPSREEQHALKRGCEKLSTNYAPCRRPDLAVTGRGCRRNRRRASTRQHGRRSRLGRRSSRPPRWRRKRARKNPGLVRAAESRHPRVRSSKSYADYYSGGRPHWRTDVRKLTSFPLAAGSRHPFDTLVDRAYKANERLLRIQLRARQLHGMGAHSLRLPLPVVRPPVVS